MVGLAVVVVGFGVVVLIVVNLAVIVQVCFSVDSINTSLRAFEV